MTAYDADEEARHQRRLRAMRMLGEIERAETHNAMILAAAVIILIGALVVGMMQ